MSITGILNSGLSALQTNTAALRVVSGNISNLNTPGYARRVVNLEPLTSNADVSGVQISDVQRVVDQFLSQETLTASATSSRYDAQGNVYDQINALLGKPGDGSALTSQLSNVFSALSNAALSPTSASNQNSVLNNLQGFASSISSLASSITGLQQQTDSQVSTSVTTINTLLSQISGLNKQIKIASASGNTDSTFLDQLDVALQSLSQQTDVRVSQQGDGSVLVSTLDGTSLVSGDTYAQLSYQQGGVNGIYQPIMYQVLNAQTGVQIGNTQDFSSHLAGGSLKGLIDMRDSTLPDLLNELGSFAQGAALSFNAQHNANSAFPPPTTLDGRNTGLLATDALNFSGKTTIAITDSSGVLQHRVDVDFGAGTLSVDGGAAVSFANTIDTTVGGVNGFVTSLNTALTPMGASASFSNGQLTISAGGSNGVVVSDQDTANPSSRGGTAFSQFFGLNDLFQSGVPSVLTTGVSGSDTTGANGQVQLVLKGPNGDIVKNVSVNVTAGMTMSQFTTALNTAMSGYASFTLNSDGSMSTSVSNNYPNYRVLVSSDSTARGTTGMSLTALFGLGANQMGQQAVGFAVTPDISLDSARLAFAKADFSTSQIVGPGDSSGLVALQNLATAPQTFAKVGALGSQATSLSNYAGGFYQDVATRTSTSKSNQTVQDDRLTEAKSRQSAVSGVNIDEELSNMIVYQQAYSAGARLITTADQLFQVLLSIQ